MQKYDTTHNAGEAELSRLEISFRAIVGPRQSGKTTLAELTFPDYRRVSLEDFDNMEFAGEDPRGFIATSPSHTIIDEVQRVPALLSYLQTHADTRKQMGMYVLTGSQNFLLMDAIDQSLSGRTGILTLLPLSNEELKAEKLVASTIDEQIFNGAYPALFDRNIEPSDYYPSYIMTYLERDVRMMKSIESISKFRKFLKLCAGRIGSLLNKNSLSVECGVSAPTIDSWLSVLEESYVIFYLRADHNNFSKRLVKSPKLYFYDTGLACSLLEIKDASQLRLHYMRGALFENMVVSEFIKRDLNRGIEPSLSFWRASTGHEVDVICSQGITRKAYEIKSGATFSQDYFKGLLYWSDLSGTGPEDRAVIYAGDTSMQTSSGRVIAWKYL